MDKAKALSEKCELPPLRTLNDFLLESSRFQLPNFRDLEKWGNRVAHNLVYYQTNYLYMSIIIMLIVASFNPVKMIAGILPMAAICCDYYYLFGQNDTLLKFKRSYPQVGIVFTIVSAAYVLYSINSLIFILFSILLPFCVIFIHASLRLRSLKNKVVNKLEGIGLDRTPMGLVLNSFEGALGITVRKQTTIIESLR